MPVSTLCSGVWALVGERSKLCDAHTAHGHSKEGWTSFEGHPVFTSEFSWYIKTHFLLESFILSPQQADLRQLLIL